MDRDWRGREFFPSINDSDRFGHKSTYISKLLPCLFRENTINNLNYNKMELTEKAILKMKHAVGNGSRNFFGTRTPDPVWEELVEAGYASKARNEMFNEIVYRVTKKGKDALSRILA